MQQSNQQAVVRNCIQRHSGSSSDNDESHICNSWFPLNQFYLWRVGEEQLKSKLYALTLCSENLLHKFFAKTQHGRRHGLFSSLEGIFAFQ